LQHLWITAKCYKNTKPTKRPDNDDWFNGFCFKVASFYVPSETEICPVNFPQPSTPHILTNNFNMTKLNFAIASGLDNISPIMLKYLPLTL